jgi:hypothetical protein
MLFETILGGVTGLVGSLVTSIMNYKTMKEKNAHEIALIQAQTSAMRAEAEAQIQVTKAQIEGAIELADAQAYMAGQVAGNEPLFGQNWVDKLLGTTGWLSYVAGPVACLVAFCFGFVDWLRGIMRPILTAYLVGCSSYITWLAWEIVQKYGQGMTSTQATEIYQSVVEVILYLTVSCVTWWFGDRTMSKYLMNNKLNSRNNYYQ